MGMPDTTRLRAELGSWIPAGGGLRDDDWARRHRLLTTLLAATVAGLTVFGALRGHLGVALVAVLTVLPCVVAAVRLRPRRLPSICVALGFTIACGAFVSMNGGLTEAHFTFFIAVAALALYRDWAPFGVFLIATTLHHAVFGALLSERTYDHHSARVHPWTWALLHGLAVLLAAAFQVVAWRLTEAEERRADDDLAEHRAQLTIAFEQTPVPMAMWAPDGRIVRMNTAYRAWLGLPAELPPGFCLQDLPLEPLTADAQDVFDQMLTAERPVTFTRPYRRADDGSVIWVEIHSNGVRDRQGRLRLIYVHCLDVTRQQEHEAELHRQIRQDPLTGLLSRKAFEQELADLLAGRDGPVSVIYLDVDRFKAVNDGSGHGTGDDVLRALADRLSATVPAGSLVARLGGDEFVVALPGPVATAAAAGQEILAALAEPLVVRDGRVRLAASVGVAAGRGAGEAEPVVQAADTAMYAAKRAGGNRLEIFTEQMRVSVRERISAEKMLRQALDGDREPALPVWFQPIVAPATGRIVGAEALVRMRAADGRMLSPGQFIPAAEETGLVVPLGEHVLAAALRHLLRWSDDLGYVSVNVSPRQLAEPGFVPTLSRLLAESGLTDPSRLLLEVTETALLSTSVDIQARLAAIKRLGVRIALDDFGTGYSSLTWLQSVPADVVKLDRSFVAGLAHDARKASIISAVLWLARSLTMSVVAEGVEDVDDWAALSVTDCAAIQGYYYSPPVPPAEFEVLLRQGTRAMITA
ncbi:MAG TPA: EAL domain-containing protein [Actinoplanes sp.]|nr:EAL domain-containing protein [Actinoplanes sp.]